MAIDFDALMERLQPETRDTLVADVRAPVAAAIVGELRAAGLELKLPPSDEGEAPVYLPPDFIDYLEARASPGGG